MKNRLLHAAFAFIALTSVFGHAANATPPNVVIIFVDDLGYGDIGPFGANRQKTPHLNRMAEEGMKLTSFYAATVCSVSRAQLLTGCYGARVSVPGVFFPASPNGLHPQEWTIAERLKEQGYTTACIGKWHLGDQPDFLPTRQGFDHYFGIPYSNDMQRVSSDSGKKVVPLLRDDKVVELLTDEQQSQITERYTEEAIQFIRSAKDKPFLLYFPHTAVHTPIWPGKAFQGQSSNGRFGDWVEEVDWSTGKVLDCLRELKLESNTLVIFTSDNGPWLIKGSDGGSAGPLRGGKGSTWEGGVRVPTIAWWPGKIKAQSTCDVVAGTIDLLPTAVTLAGGSLADQRSGGAVIDGRDLSPVLFGQSEHSPREAHYYFAGYNLQAVRQGPWKLAIAPQPETTGQGTIPDDHKAAPRLYHLDSDIGEKQNVIQDHPEIATRLSALAEKMNAEIGGQSPTARRPAGVVSNPQTLYPTSEAKAVAKPPKATALDKLKSGDSVKSNAAPQIAKRPFTISLTLETQQRDAIVIAHGGAVAGYAIHLKNGRLHFTVRTGSGPAFKDVVAREEFTGRESITASLAADGTLSLQTDQQPAVTSKATSLISRQPQEDFCVGTDTAQPVAIYSTGDRLVGTISALKISVQ
jgi:arylsulfatase A